MARTRPTPIPVERPFEIDELFFSTTNAKGIMTSGNRVFVRVSAYTEPELIGEPHNLIRHPDMPRAVFRLLWDYLEAGRPIAAYVKNRAKTGGYYWVLATVTAIDGGYLSVRLKPSSELLPAVEGLYAELRALEREVERDGGTPKDAIAASTPRLAQRLGELGFGSYDAFMQAALPTEIRSRQAILGRAAAARTVLAHEGRRCDLERALAASDALHRFLEGEFEKLDRYGELHRTLAGQSDFVLGLADDIRLFSLNAQIAAARLHDAGAALGVVANIMRTRSDVTAASIREMSGEIAAAVELLGDLAFAISMTTLQSEMTARFVSELVEDARPDSRAEDREPGSPPETVAPGSPSHRPDTVATSVAALATCLDRQVGPLLSSLAQLDARLGRVETCVSELGRELARLDALQIAGRIETARLTEGGEFRVLFEEIRTQIEAAANGLRGFSIVRAVREGGRSTRSDVAIRQTLAAIQDWAAAAA